ncbi:Nif3-like dinuclear metal center hexameric protein [Kocuria sp. cx-116]|uniref:Nif3-like dinuclear metal center hexameric protein n=1 Tax=Kocuria sp. cx-116 TaxID=2771378 RepID=UPI0016846AC6|nr:Nif3-like dinuclear metal center hexameric protein [Kocuria sp. cx-116]MBD2763356.1 Nif3-like dinuclear metal center hexameric protein [Kocuria sp. cx-116]
MTSEAQAQHRSTPTLAQVVDAADSLWPFRLQEDWDASGLITGRPDQPVRRVLVAVDPVAPVIAEALQRQADLVITHHPLLLRGATSVAADGFKGQVIHDLIENRCALLACHTNADSARRGVSDALIAATGVNPDDAVPLVPDDTHPNAGLGRVGALPRSVSLRELAQRLTTNLPGTAQGLRIAGDPDRMITTVAVCGGAGDSLFDRVRATGADVYITADLRHHPASEAREHALGPGGDGTPALIDAAHAASEALWLPWGAEDLQRALAARGFDVEISVSDVRTDPWDFRVASPNSDPTPHHITGESS